MDTSTALGLVLVVVLVLANGFFVATEFAIVGVRRSRLDQLAAEGDANAKVAQQVVGHLDTYIAACQLGITMASLALGWLGEPAFAHLVEPPLEALIGNFAPTASHGIAVGISFAIITTLHIVIGELAPKGLALQAPEGTSLWVARPLQVFEVIFRWPIALLNSVGNGVLKLFGLHAAAGHEMVHSVDELRLLVNATQQAGGVEESEARIAARAFTFADLTAVALMTPRTEVAALSIDAIADEALKVIRASRHNRLPVYEGSMDYIVGVVHALDFYDALTAARGSGVEESRGAVSLRALLRPVMTVPATKPADDVLDEMRVLGQYFAVVIDEYGGTAGVLTFDDLVEALVGPMRREQGEAQDTGAVPPIEVGDGSLLMDGLTRLDEWEEATGVQLSEEDHDLAETVGGLVMHRLGRIPEVGDEIAVDGHTLRVEALDGLRVASVRLQTSGQQTVAP